MSTPEQIERVTNKLSQSIEEVLRYTIEVWVGVRRKDKEAKSRSSFEEAHAEFSKQVAAGHFHGLTTLPAVLHSIKFKWPKGRTFESASDAIRRMPVKATFSPGSVAWRDTLSIAELREDGVLRRASFHDITSARKQASFTGHIDSGKFLMADYLQKNLAIRIGNDLEFLAKLGIGPPWVVGSSLVGAKDFMLLDIGAIGAPRKVESNELNLPIVKITSMDQVKKRGENAGPFAAALNWLAQSVGWPKSTAMLPDSSWKVREVDKIKD